MSKKKSRKIKKIEYYGQHDLREIQNKYFAQYDYNFWMHKANLINLFIHNPEHITKLKFEGDVFSDDVIKEGLKMELHMTAMHCTESFFRLIQAMVYNPELPWIGMAQCSADELYLFIKSIKMNGLVSIVPNTNEWLRINLYPTINKEHAMYEKSIASANFVIAYIDRLALEFIEHKEYNSYKHGFHCFPGSLSIQAFGEDTGKKYLESSNYVVEYLEFGKTETDGKKEVRITTKAYSNVKDYNIIMTNSGVLHNIHKFKGMAAASRLKGESEESPIKHGYYYFDDRNVIDIFLDNDTTGAVKKFTF